MKEESSWVDRIEENLIAVILGTMALLTFANVVARYVFNSNIFWALELTVFLFAWLVLLGATYAVKKTSHLGVDAIINTLGSKKRKILALFAAFICIFYAFLMLKGSWDYWAPYANLPTTEGRWFPIGFDFTVRGRGWYETQDIPVPFFMRWLETVFNDGMEYENILTKERGGSKISIIFSLLKRNLLLLPIILKFKPDLLIGTCNYRSTR